MVPLLRIDGTQLNSTQFNTQLNPYNGGYSTQFNSLLHSIQYSTLCHHSTPYLYPCICRSPHAIILNPSSTTYWIQNYERSSEGLSRFSGHYPRTPRLYLAFSSPHAIILVPWLYLAFRSIPGIDSSGLCWVSFRVAFRSVSVPCVCLSFFSFTTHMSGFSRWTNSGWPGGDPEARMEHLLLQENRREKQIHTNIDYCQSTTLQYTINRLLPIPIQENSNTDTNRLLPIPGKLQYTINRLPQEIRHQSTHGSPLTSTTANRKTRNTHYHIDDRNTIPIRKEYHQLKERKSPIDNQTKSRMTPRHMEGNTINPIPILIKGQYPYSTQTPVKYSLQGSPSLPWSRLPVPIWKRTKPTINRGLSIPFSTRK